MGNSAEIKCDQGHTGIVKSCYCQVFQCNKVYSQKARSSTSVNQLITSDKYRYIKTLIKNKLSLENSMVDKNILSRQQLEYLLS